MVTKSKKKKHIGIFKISFLRNLFKGAIAFEISYKGDLMKKVLEIPV